MQLRVLEGPTLDEAKDITNGYNVNFFVYVDLQHARPMANGRVQTPAATSPPVLTGSPVSGMALLDRPAEAGYFLFPDLSVRHEGRYVLGFTLYEEVKEDHDQDAEPQDDDGTPGFYQRMRVVSQPFVVFSAKKFPGLKHSTDLSRTISEQGCRVRIRREVRMRRRGESKQEGGAGGNDASRPRPRAQTPVDGRPRELPGQYRGRSDSNSSHHREPYIVPERRPSEVDAYPPPPPGPVASPHMRYGSDSKPPYTSQYGPGAPVPPPISPTTTHYPSQPSPYTSAPPPPAAYGYPSRSVPSYPPTPSDTYDRRSSTATAMPPSPSHSHFAPKDEYRRESAFKLEADHPTKLEAEYPKMEPRRESISLNGGNMPRLPSLDEMTRKPPMAGPSAFSLPPYSQPPSTTRPADYIEPAPPSKPMPQETVHAGSKRGFTDSFADNTASLHNGQRPQDHHHKLGGRDLYELDVNSNCMVYPRADGQLTYKTSNTFYTS